MLKNESLRVLYILIVSSIIYFLKRNQINPLLEEMREGGQSKRQVAVDFAKRNPVFAFFSVLFVLVLPFQPFSRLDILANFLAVLTSYLVTLCIGLFCKGSLMRFGLLGGNQDKAKQHVRGAQQVAATDLMKALQSQTTQECIPITADLRIPVRYEPQHFFAIGRPGCGKSQLFYRAIDNVKYRSKKAMVYDFKGDMVQKFYDAGKDILFNPFDTRCAGWNIFNEIESQLDVRSIANSLIPVTGNDPYWSNAARDVFAGILLACYVNDCKTNADVYDAANLPCSELYRLLGSVPGCETGARHVAQEKAGQSILSVMSTATQCFTYLREIDGDFSIKKWVQDESDTRTVFLTNYSEISESIKPALSLLVDLAGKRGLSLNDDRDRRLFVFLDEFGTLQNLPTIVTMLTNGRSKGLSIWLAIQDIGQIEKIYGREISQTIVNSCASSFTFAVSDPTTAEFLSKKIGDREVIQTHVSRSANQNFGQSSSQGSSTNISSQSLTERVFLPSQIMGMADLQVIVKLPEYDPTALALPLISIESVAPSFLQRKDFNLSAGKAGSVVKKVLSKAASSMPEFSEEVFKEIDK